MSVTEARCSTEDKFRLHLYMDKGRKYFKWELERENELFYK